MKKQLSFIFTAVLLLATTVIDAQAPQGFNYQAVIRDGAGNLITTGTVSLRFTIHQTTAGGTNVYQETQSVNPNAYGLVTAIIGGGTQVGLNTFSSVAWGTDLFFLQSEADPSGGSNYVSLGAATQFESVPYALSALSSADNNWSSSGGNIYNNNGGNVGIGTSTPFTQLANTSNNIYGSDGYGLSPTSLGWQSNGFGYAAGFYNPAASVASGGVTVKIHGNAAPVLDLSASDSVSVMRISGNGNVGIGTTAPSASLHVVGNGIFTGSVGIGTTIPSGTLEVDGSSVLNGNVGIGTSTPSTQLANTSNNIYGTDGYGLSATSLGWQSNGFGYAGGFYNSGSGIASGGVTIKIHDNGSPVLDLSASDSVPIMRVNGNGSVGIGTTSPLATLDVSGSPITTPNLSREYFNEGSGASGFIAATSPSGGVQVRANGYFWADGGGFVATSDKRIKSIIGYSDNNADLAVLNSIKITDYTYIDKVKNGNRPQKKVIAQQVREVYPTAINENKGFIPNVYEAAKQVTVAGNTTKIVTAKPHSFATGDKVKMILEKGGTKELEVAVIDEHTFSISEVINDNIFVYGKWVNDLLNVDYEAIAMLNVSATQELYKLISGLKTENEKLKSDNAGFNAELQTYSKANASLQADVEAIKAQLGIGSQANIK